MCFFFNKKNYIFKARIGSGWRVPTVSRRQDNFTGRTGRQWTVPCGNRASQTNSPTPIANRCASTCSSTTTDCMTLIARIPCAFCANCRNSLSLAFDYIPISSGYIYLNYKSQFLNNKTIKRNMKYIQTLGKK